MAADTIAMSIRIVSPAKDTCIGDIVWEEIAEPVDPIRGGPGFVSMPVQAVDDDDARRTSVRSAELEGWLTRRQG